MTEMKNQRYNVPVLLLLALIPYSAAEFAEYPVNVSLPIGSEMKAVFRCQHQSGDATIGWKVNNSSLNLFPNITTSSVSENGARVFMLTIPARSEYNGTEVVCVAFFLDGSPTEITPSVILIIIEGEDPTTTVNMATTAEAMETPLPTTAAVATTTRRRTTDMTSTEATTMALTTEEPTTDVEVSTTEPTITGFDKVPSPTLLIVMLEVQYTYVCNHSATKLITWRVNDRVLGVEIFNISGIIEYTDRLSHPGDAVHTLTIRAVSQNNQTTIQCTAAFRDGFGPEDTPIANFVIQGPLQSIGNPIRISNSLSWVAPFSLDLTDVDPDIVYCVELYNITCGRRDLIISDCNVTEPSYIYTSDSNFTEGYIYEYTVIPRSNVEGARNGTSLTVSEVFVMWKLSSRGYELNVSDAENALLPTKIFVNVYLSIHDVQHKESQVHVYADSHTISLISLDGYDDGKDLELTVLVRNESSMVLQVVLPYRRLWNYTILAYGCKEHPVTEVTLLSTHDIQNILFSSPLPGQVRVTGNFIPGSSVTGILVAILTTSESLYLHVIERNNDQPQIQETVMGIDDGLHNVSVFVVEKNGLLFNRTAIMPQTVNVMNITGSVNQSYPISYELHPNPIGVCIDCTFLDTSTTCVAVVQLKSSGLMGIESSHTFTRTGVKASGCIEGINLIDYHIGVIDGIQSRMEPTVTENNGVSSTVWVAVGIIIVATVLLVATAITPISLLLYTSNRGGKKRQSEDVVIHLTESPLPSCNKKDDESNFLQCAPFRENTPLLQTEPVADGSTSQSTQQAKKSTIAPAREHESKVITATPPPFPLARIEADSTTVVYAEINSSKLGNISIPLSTEEVAYREIKKYKSELGHHYATLAISGSAGEVPENDPLKVVYCVIDPKSQVARDKILRKQPTLTKQDAPSSTPFTLENLLSKLLSLASKWLSLGEALSLDDDRLDEIYTNNETDEACLQEMLELYLARPDQDHNWEAIHEAVKKIGEVLAKETSSDVEVRKDELEKKQHEESFLPMSETKDLKGNAQLTKEDLEKKVSFSQGSIRGGTDNLKGDVELRNDDLEKKLCEELFLSGSERSETENWKESEIDVMPSQCIQ